VHQSSFDKMVQFGLDYLHVLRDRPLRIVDVGSRDINGSYRSFFDRRPWTYVGVDTCDGDNVDIVIRDPYDWRELPRYWADVVISGQTLEHVEFIWGSICEMARILKPGGLCCIIVPSSGPQHRYPLDCWRFYPDGLRALARYAALEVLEVKTQWKNLSYYHSQSNKWHDCVLIARK